MSTKKKTAAVATPKKYRDLRDMEWQMNDALRKAQEKVESKKRELQECIAIHDLIKKRIQAAVEAAGQSLLETEALQPYDAKLAELLANSAWAATKIKGGTDAEIRDKLSKSFSPYSSPNSHNPDIIRGGGKPAAWFGAKDYNDKPTIDGAKLVSEVRRMLAIPQPDKAAATPAAKPKAKKKAAPKSKGAKSMDVVASNPAAAKKPVNALPSGQKQTFLQWCSSLEASVSKDGTKIDREDPRLKQWYGQGLAAREAGAKLKSDQIVDKKPATDWLEEDEGYDGGLSVEIEGGQTYFPDQVKVAPLSLKLAMDGLRVLPAAPKFETEDIGLIGMPVTVDGNEYAVVSAAEKSTATLYELHPIAKNGSSQAFVWIRDGLKLESALTRWKANEGSIAPESIELDGVIVRDDEDREWVLGFGDDVIYVEVEKVAASKADPGERHQGFEHISIPKTKELGVKLTVDLAVVSREGREGWAAGCTIAPEGKTPASREPGQETYANRAAAILDGCEQLIERLRKEESGGTSPDAVRRATGSIRAVMAFAEQTRKASAAPPPPPESGPARMFPPSKSGKNPKRPSLAAAAARGLGGTAA